MSGWVFLLMAVVAVVMLYPFYYLLDNAFRTQKQFDQQSGHSLSSWTQLFRELPVGQETAELAADLRGLDRDHPDRVHDAPGSRSPSSASAAAGWSSCWWSPR